MKNLVRVQSSRSIAAASAEITVKYGVIITRCRRRGFGDNGRPLGVSRLADGSGQVG